MRKYGTWRAAISDNDLGLICDGPVRLTALHFKLQERLKKGLAVQPIPPWLPSCSVQEETGIVMLTAVEVFMRAF